MVEYDCDTLVCAPKATSHRKGKKRKATRKLADPGRREGKGEIIAHLARRLARRARELQLD